MKWCGLVGGYTASLCVRRENNTDRLGAYLDIKFPESLEGLMFGTNPDVGLHVEI